jgi:two-component system chemotaxis sensor kinase CheA
MDLDPEFRAQLLAVFQGELSEQLELARAALDKLDAGLEGEARKEASDSVVRVAHNLKGATRGVGIDDASEIAYDLESMMALVRDGSIP